MHCALLTSLALATAAAIAVACASPSSSSVADEGGPRPTPTLGAGRDSFPEDASLGIQARYVLGGCAGGPESACHGIGAGGMVLPDGTPSNLIDVPATEQPALRRIKLGDPANSYLYRKIMGGPAIDGGRMPLDQQPLDDRSISAIAAWIEAGAPAP
jgi:hypothetical protein